jgi:hypothetical protein
MRFKCAVSLLLLSLSGYAHAGPYADQLVNCLIDSTTPADRAALVRWMFAAIAASPAVAPIAKVSPQVVDQVNAAAGSMYMKLLTESCRDKAKEALAHEGPATLQLGFQVLGRVAAGEVFASPEVRQAVSGVQKYLDEKKLQALTAK